MKANEAPEKIYLIRNISTSTSLNTTDDCHEKYLQEWYKSREKDADVEYIRADVFIKKAYEWLKENGGRYWMDDYDLPTDELVKDFVNYIKGELNK